MRDRGEMPITIHGDGLATTRILPWKWGEPQPPPPLFGAKIFHCTGHCAGPTFFGKTPQQGIAW